MGRLSEILRAEGCSLVVRDSAGAITTYSSTGVRDLEYLLDHHPERLRGAAIADKVIGKAAAGMAIYGGVTDIYAEVMSRKALPMLQSSGVRFGFGLLVDRIVIPGDNGRCPLERIVEECTTPAEVVATLRQHFKEMQQRCTQQQVHQNK